MNTMTCDEVQAALELHAAAECDRPTVAAIERHLAGCRACARAYAGARQLAGLLDLHYRAPGQLQRLRMRLEDEARPRRARLLPLVRRAAAVAALLLVTIGLTRWVGNDISVEEADRGLDVALVAVAPPGLPEHVGVRAQPAFFKGAMDRVPRRYRLDLSGRTPSAYRRELLAPGGPSRLPPPEVDLALQVHNDSGRPVLVRLDDRSEIRLDLHGPGVFDVAVRDPAFRALGAAQLLTVPAGGTVAVPVPRLVSRRGGAVHYTYWTGPGLYTLTVRLRVALSRDGGRTFAPLTLRPPPLRMDVRAGS